MQPFNYRVLHFFCRILHQHNSPAACVRELFKPSKDAAYLVVPIKKLGRFRFEFFVGDVIIEASFRPFWPRLPGPGHQPLNGNFWLKLLLENRLESESSEPLIAFLAFVVQTLWPVNNKVII